MILFLSFFVFTAGVFFLPNTWWVVSLTYIAILLYCLCRRIKIAKVLRGTVRIMPFILLTFGSNVWLDNLQVAVFVTMKLIAVCWATLAYAQTLSALEFAGLVGRSLSPLRRLGFDVDSVCLVICLALSMVSTLRREMTETKYAVRAKGMSLNIRNTYYVTVRLFTRMIRRVDELDMALKAKGVS